MNKNIKSVMTKKELEIIEMSSREGVRLLTNQRIKKYLNAAQGIRNKYRDLVNLHRGSNRHRPNRNHIEKVHIFGVLLGRLDRQYKKNIAAGE